MAGSNESWTWAASHLSSCQFSLPGIFCHFMETILVLSLKLEKFQVIQYRMFIKSKLSNRIILLKIAHVQTTGQTSMSLLGPSQMCRPNEFCLKLCFQTCLHTHTHTFSHSVIHLYFVWIRISRPWEWEEMSLTPLLYKRLTRNWTCFTANRTGLNHVYNGWFRLGILLAI